MGIFDLQIWRIMLNFAHKLNYPHIRIEFLKTKY